MLRICLKIDDLDFNFGWVKEINSLMIFIDNLVKYNKIYFGG